MNLQKYNIERRGPATITHILAQHCLWDYEHTLYDGRCGMPFSVYSMPPVGGTLGRYVVQPVNKNHRKELIQSIGGRGKRIK